MPLKIPDKQLLRPSDVAKFLGLDVTTIRRWCREGKIRSHKLPGSANYSSYIIERDDVMNIFADPSAEGENHEN